MYTGNKKLTILFKIHIQANVAIEIPFIVVYSTAAFRSFLLFYAMVDISITFASLIIILVFLTLHNSLVEFFTKTGPKSLTKDAVGFICSFLAIVIWWGIVFGGDNMGLEGRKNMYAGLTALKLYYFCKICRSVLEEYHAGYMKEVPLKEVVENVVNVLKSTTTKSLSAPSTPSSKRGKSKSSLASSAGKIDSKSKASGVQLASLQIMETDQLGAADDVIVQINPQHDNADNANGDDDMYDPQEEIEIMQAYQTHTAIEKRRSSMAIQQKAAAKGDQRELNREQEEMERMRFVFGSDEMEEDADQESKRLELMQRIRLEKRASVVATQSQPLGFLPLAAAVVKTVVVYDDDASSDASSSDDDYEQLEGDENGDGEQNADRGAGDQPWRSSLPPRVLPHSVIIEDPKEEEKEEEQGTQVKRNLPRASLRRESFKSKQQPSKDIAGVNQDKNESDREQDGSVLQYLAVSMEDVLDPTNPLHPKESPHTLKSILSSAVIPVPAPIPVPARDRKPSFSRKSSTSPAISTPSPASPPVVGVKPSVILDRANSLTRSRSRSNSAIQTVVADVYVAPDAISSSSPTVSTLLSTEPPNLSLSSSPITTDTVALELESPDQERNSNILEERKPQPPPRSDKPSFTRKASLSSAQGTFPVNRQSTTSSQPPPLPSKSPVLLDRMNSISKPTVPKPPTENERQQSHSASETAPASPPANTIPSMIASPPSVPKQKDRPLIARSSSLVKKQPNPPNSAITNPSSTTTAAAGRPPPPVPPLKSSAALKRPSIAAIIAERPAEVISLVAKLEQAAGASTSVLSSSANTPTKRRSEEKS